MIELKNVSFRYDKTVEEYQIDTVSFHVKQGEWLSIVGHNGSGKSTVVRLIDGLLEAESGEIYIDGKQLTRETIWEIRSKIGIVFQNPDNQFVGATVEDDVAFGLENQEFHGKKCFNVWRRLLSKLVCWSLKIANHLVCQVVKSNGWL